MNSDFGSSTWGAYDMILGAGWLEQHSPMIVDWKAKYIQFPTPMGRAHLFGHEANSTTCHVINRVQLQNLHRQGSLLHVIILYCTSLRKGRQAIQQNHLIYNNSWLNSTMYSVNLQAFQRAAFDHTIPLVPGVQPINIRPYRHKPENKTEIKRQVAELLQ